MRGGLKTIGGIGEDELINALLAELPKTNSGEAILAAAGDDCAVVRGAGAKNWQLLKTDCVIEGVHFARGTPPAQIGWKALCRPLSDIAAMGGQPAYALVTLALPGSATLALARGIYSGLGRAAREFGVEIVGGETSRSPGPCFISVCLTGSVSARRCIFRTGGRAGDRLYVTGRLGGSLSSGRHLTFRPRLAEGQWLAAHFPPRAMMDLSDGVAKDLLRLAAAAGTGYRLNRLLVPRNRGCTTEQALSDGEDYELLFAIGPRSAKALESQWPQEFPKVPLTRIGELTAETEKSGLDEAVGFDHFATS